LPAIPSKLTKRYEDSRCLTICEYQVPGLDGNTGEVKARWAFPDDRRLWNSFSGDFPWFEDGDFLLRGLFVIKRLNAGDGKWATHPVNHGAPDPALERQVKRHTGRHKAAAT
jgi:hypothetical protein